jgi:hypothetical protein
MSCDSNNWQAQSAFSDLNTIVKLVSIEMDNIEEAIVMEEKGTREHKALSVRRVRLEEIYDRVSDLAETVNVPENNHEECDDDDCNC